MTEDLKHVKGLLRRGPIKGASRKAIIGALAVELTRDFDGLEAERQDALRGLLTYPLPGLPVHVRLDECDGELLLGGIVGLGRARWMPKLRSGSSAEAELLGDVRGYLKVHVGDLHAYVLIVHVDAGYATGRFHRWGAQAGQKLDHLFRSVVVWPRAKLDNDGVAWCGCLPPSMLGREMASVRDGKVLSDAPEMLVLVPGSSWLEAGESVVSGHQVRLGTVLHAGTGDVEEVLGAVFASEGERLHPADVLQRLASLRRDRPELHDMHIIWTDLRSSPAGAPWWSNPR